MPAEPFHELRPEFEEEASSDGRALSLTALEWLHLVAMAGMILLTLLIAYGYRGPAGYGIAAGFAALCGVALAIGHVIRIPLGDFYRDFQYREKFVLFLVHLAVVIVPFVGFGLRDWRHLSSIFLIFLCLQPVDRVFIGRIYAAASAIVFFTLFFLVIPPPWWLVALWICSLILVFRLEAVRLRIEKFGVKTGISFWRLVGPVWLPAAAALAAGLPVYGLAGRFLRPRALQFQPGAIERPVGTTGYPLSQLLLEAFLVTAIIIATLVLLNWLDKKLRGKRKSKVEEMELSGYERTLKAPGEEKDESALLEDEEEGPRKRILRAFADFQRRLAIMGQGRSAGETAEEYLHRLAPLSEKEDFPPETHGSFDLACYSREEIESRLARDFENFLQEQTNAILARVRAAEAAEPVAEEEAGENGEPKS